MAKLTTTTKSSTKKHSSKKTSTPKKELKTSPTNSTTKTSPTKSTTKEAKQKMGFWKTWAKIMFSPNEFFEQLPKEVKYKEPSFFAIKIQAILIGLFALMFLLLGTIFVGVLSTMAPMVSAFGGAGMGIFFLFLLILFPIALFFGWVMLFVSAGIYHLFVLMLGGKESYQETFKAITYAGAPVLLGIIPYVGFLSFFYILYLEIIGIHHRQKLSIGKSAAVVLIPLVLIVLLMIALMAVFLLPLMMNY